MGSSTPNRRSSDGHFEWNDKMTKDRICASRLEIIEDGDVARVLDFEVIKDKATLVVWFNVLDEQGIDFMLDFRLSGIAKQNNNGDGDVIDVLNALTLTSTLEGHGQHSPGYPTSWIFSCDDFDQNNAEVKVDLYLSIDEILLMPHPREDEDRASAA